MVKQGARWRIGSGVHIPFLGAPWLKDGLSLSTTNPVFEPLMQVKFSEFIDQDLKMWKAPLICSCLMRALPKLFLTHRFSHLLRKIK